MSSLRAVLVLSNFFLFTIFLMPVQWGLLVANSKYATLLPNWYHRKVCRIFGIRLNLEGELDSGKPVLVVVNHSSWLDIPVISAVAPVSFIAKKEVASWPFFGWLAKLQRTVFVDRSRRSSLPSTTNSIVERLAAGEKIILFAEGTSSDGNRVLPFKSSLFAAVQDTQRMKNGALRSAQIQTMAIAYTHLHGIPIGRQERPLVSWYGDMDMVSHIWTVARGGPLDVEIKLSEPTSLSSVGDRKALAKMSEVRIRRDVSSLITGRTPYVGEPERIFSDGYESFV